MSFEAKVTVVREKDYNSRETERAFNLYLPLIFLGVKIKIFLGEKMNIFLGEKMKIFLGGNIKIFHTPDINV